MKNFLKLAIAALVVTGATATAQAQKLDSVSLRLSWYIGGYHAAYYLGKDKGFYQQEGIDLTINEGRGSANTAQIVAGKADTFGVSDSSSMMLGAAKGLPIKTVVSLMNGAGFAVLMLDDAPIKTASDLKGKRIATSPGDALTQLLPAVLAANKLTKNDVHIIMLDPAGKQAALLDKKVDAMLGDVGAQGVILAERGHKIRSLRFGDIGIETIGLIIHTHRDTIKENPDLVRRFVKATVRSWEAAKADPAAAVKSVQAVKPDIPANVVLNQLKTFISLMDTPATKGKPLGYGAPADWEHTYKLYTELRDMKTDMKPGDFYTNEFLPKQ
jgi:NitT/TauT family transport system substrate-binding protein